MDLAIVIIVIAIGIALGVGLKVLLVVLAKKGIDIFSKKKNDKKD